MVSNEHPTLGVPHFFFISAHIFFDDAFLRKSKDDNDPTLNVYVQDLISTMEKAAAAVHKTEGKVYKLKT